MIYCTCKQSYGKYIDNLNATISLTAIPIGINNTSFVDALKQRPYLMKGGPGCRFEAFVIPDECPTIKVIN